MADLTPETVADLLAKVTPGHWAMETVRTSCGVCHKVGPWPHKWRAGTDMSACIYDDYPSPPEGTDTMLANARLIAMAPDLARKVIAQAAQIERLRAAAEALGALPEGYCFCSKHRIGDDSKIHEPECADLRAALQSEVSHG